MAGQDENKKSRLRAFARTRAKKYLRHKHLGVKMMDACFKQKLIDIFPPNITNTKI